MAGVNYTPRPDGVDIVRIADSFDAALEKDAGIELTSYIDAFSELARFFDLMGALFATMASDIREQVKILERYLQSPEAAHYATVASLVAHEAAEPERRLEPKRKEKEPAQSASRTVLHLNRTLEFFMGFLAKVETAGDAEKLPALCTPVYKATLGTHHSWLLSKAAGLAIGTLPTKVQLCEKVSKYDYPHTQQATARVVKSMEKVFRATDALFTQHDLHKLPF
ncbi:ceramide-1-phosphate transfer protein-like [Paramacrobiotus metropolitanus]|uniref:ceramide-1-phosphate transfer protein-like n=1 Tax=Paramacrobiotus metropolitanus TaxID=2943436 RepID=UPI0024455F0F|nr:ceramide-1-phosphate transfer protein-like [Paramacrobiotus metropolitanus]